MPSFTQSFPLTSAAIESLEGTTVTSVGPVINASQTAGQVATATDIWSLAAAPGNMIRNGVTIATVSPKNILTNTTNQGVATGTPGTLPTFWFFLNTVAGVSTTVVGFGNDATTNLPYIDIRWNGTMGANGPGVIFDGSNLPCLPSVAYTASFYYSMVAGSTTNIAGFRLNVNELDSVGTFLAGPTASPAAPTATLTRYTSTWTNAGTAAILVPYFAFLGTTGTVIDITLRLAGFQIEQSSAATTFTPKFTLANVQKLQYSNHTVYQQNTDLNWWRWATSTSTWIYSTPPPAAQPVLVGLITDTWPGTTTGITNWNQAVSYLGFQPRGYGFEWDVGQFASAWVSFCQNQLAAMQGMCSALGVPNFVPLVTLPMADPTFTSTSNPTCFQQINSGAWDSILVACINVFASAGYNPVYIRPGIEMNLSDQFQWQISIGSSGQAAWASGFQSAFQRIYRLAHNQVSGQPTVNAATKVFWCPSVVQGPVAYTGPFLDYFPGSGFVDVIGCDIYGFPLSTPTTLVNATPDTVHITLTDLLNMCNSMGKPFSIGEWGGGNDSVFAPLVANKVIASGVTVDTVTIWDLDYGTAQLAWSNWGATVGQSWRDGTAIIAPTKRNT